LPRSLGVLLLSFTLLSNIQQLNKAEVRLSGSGGPARVGSEAMIVALLQQSHDLDKQVPLQFQAFLLRMQAEHVAELRPALAREWANELFLLASQEKGRQRADTQKAAAIPYATKPVKPD
jgi:hypothetical protein